MATRGAAVASKVNDAGALERVRSGGAKTEVFAWHGVISGGILGECPIKVFSPEKRSLPRIV